MFKIHLTVTVFDSKASECLYYDSGAVIINDTESPVRAHTSSEHMKCKRE